MCREGVQFDIVGNDFILNIYYPNCEKNELEDFKVDSFEARLLFKDNILFIIFKAGNMPWMEAPYYKYLSKDLDETMLEFFLLEPIKVSLIDTAKQIVLSTKTITTDIVFMSKMVNYILDQKKMSLEEYDTKLDKIYSKYTTLDLLDQADKSPGATIKIKYEHRKSLKGIASMVSYKHYKDVPMHYGKWEVYLTDSGYNVLCIPKQFAEVAFALNNPDGYEVPINVKYFLKHMDEVERRDDYLIIPVEYSDKFGVITGEEEVF